MRKSRSILCSLGIMVFMLSFSMVLPQLSRAQLADSAWPMFRHDAQRTGRTTAFGTEVGKEKWIFDTDGPITSSPVIDENGIVYVGSSDNNLYAIDGETGYPEWIYLTGGRIKSSPAIDDNGILYVGSSDKKMYAFDLNNIDVDNPVPLWTRTTGGAIESSPAINDDGTVIVGSSDGFLYFLDPADGTDVFAPLNIGNTSSSAAIDYGADQLYIGSYENAMFAVSTTTGVAEWIYPYFCGGVQAVPAIAPDGKIIIGTHTGAEGLYCDFEWFDFNMAIFYPDDIAELQISYEYDNDTGAIESVSSVYQDPAGPADNIGDLFWRLYFQSDESIYAGVGLLENGSFIAGVSNDLYLFQPDANQYYSVSALGLRVESSPSIDGAGNIFVGTTGGKIYCLNADKPEKPEVWVYPEEEDDVLGEIISSPAIGGDVHRTVYVGSSDGNLYALDNGNMLFGNIIEVDNETGADLGNMMSVKVILKNDLTGEEKYTFTDVDGDYSFVVEPSSTYTVLAQKPGYQFDPSSQPVTVRSGDVQDVDFEGTTFAGTSISGTILDGNDVGINGVQILLTGTRGQQVTVVTDANGDYQFNGLDFDTYTITPALFGYSFSPVQKEVTIANTDAVFAKTDIDFEGIRGSFNTISGYIIEDTAPLEGVTVNLLNSLTGLAALPSVTTNADGYYSFNGVLPGIYQVAPTLSGYGFEPRDATVTMIFADVTGFNFQATSGNYITGNVYSLLTPVGTDTTVTLTSETDGSDTTVDVGLDGSYIFEGLGMGRYIVKAGTDVHNSIPKSRTIDIIDVNVSDADFVLYPKCPTVFFVFPLMARPGDTVTVYGINFGFTNPTFYGTGGVWFGESDQSTWLEAEVLTWNNFMITVTVPDGTGLVSAYVEGTDIGVDCDADPILTNFFIYDEPKEEDDDDDKIENPFDDDYFDFEFDRR